MLRRPICSGSSTRTRWRSPGCCASSALAALASNAEQLIGARALMGVGAAFVMPATLSILSDVFRSDPVGRAKAIGIWSGVTGLGVAIGPSAGGLLLAHLSWSWIFLVNLPVVATALVLGRRFVPASRAERAPTLVPVVGGIALLAAFALWERRQAQPMLDVRLFGNLRFTAASLSVTTVFFTLFGALFLLTQILQLVKGYSTVKAGFGAMPFAVTVGVTSPLAALLAKRIGTKIPVVAGLLLMAGALPPEQAGVGSAVNDTTREIGGVRGVAIVGSIANAGYVSNLGDAAAHLPAPAADAANSSLAGALFAWRALPARAAGHGAPVPAV